MEQKRNIILIGMSGVGKSTLGALLATERHIGLWDVDRYIERKQQKKISAIFATEGEEFFRKLEKESLGYMEKILNHVVVLGGGATSFLWEHEKLLKNSLIVWIKLDLEKLVYQLLHNQSYKSRPIYSRLNLHELDKPNQYLKLHEVVKAQNETRKSLFEKADVHVEIVDQNPMINMHVINRKIHEHLQSIKSTANTEVKTGIQ